MAVRATIEDAAPPLARPRAGRRAALPAGGGIGRDLTFVPRRWFAGALKRALDVVLGGAILLAALPLMAAVALVVRLDSPGPIVIRQERLGRGLRPFRVLKFRSMLADAELRRAELETLNEADGPLFKMRRDPRLTRIGGFLRRTSLDELPQLLNVLAGDMSLVGPRPPLAAEVDRDVRQVARLSCRPGMTGLAQVAGRSELAYEEMMRADLRYVRERSLRLDLAILARTPHAVISGRGAW